jgi:cell division protein FtsW
MRTNTMKDWLRNNGLNFSEDSSARPVRLGFDVPLLLITISMVVFGLLMVYSASWDFGYRFVGNPLHYLQRQIQWVLVGGALMAVVIFIRYQFLTRLALPMMLGTVAALVAVLVMGEMRHGAVRSLSSGSYQPSELIKLVLVIYLSVWLYNRRDQLKSAGLALVPLGVILGIISVLIISQPDYSAFITVCLIGVLMFFLAGADLKQILALVLVGFVVGYLAYLVSTTVQSRVDNFVAGIQSVLDADPHVQRALEAFTNGGWLGAGIGKSQAKLLGLPFPHTDSIFAVVGEEVGVIGSVALLMGYLGILWRGLSIAGRTKDELGRLLAAGVTFWLILEAMINMAVILGLMPFAGNALPFISSGGSSLIVAMLAVGILLSISRQVEQTEEKEERTFDAMVNLRRWDRRRRVSRSGRTPGAVRRG